jgi:uncharacterized phage protein gp47/JayE
VDLPSRQDLVDVARRFIRGAPNTRVNPTLVDVDGSDLNLDVGMSSVMGEAIVAAFAKCMRGSFLDSCDDTQVDRWAGDRLQLARKDEAAATVDLVLARANHAAGGGTVPAGFRVQTADGTAFALDVDVVFGATDDSQPATATALETGPEGNVPAGAITSFVDQPFDPLITPSNAAPAAGGVLREDLATFKGRCRGFFRSIRRGVLPAIQAAATAVPGVAVATATEVENPGTGLPAGAVQLVVGDANGNASSPMLQAVKDSLIDFRAAGIPVFVQGGVVVFEPVAWLLAYETGVNTVAAQEDVRSATVAINQFNAPGAPMRRSALIAAGKTVPGVIFGDGALVAPAGDVFPLDVVHIIRVRPSDVTFL